MPAQSLFEPILTPLMRNRALTLVISGAAVLQIGLTSLGLQGWPCPILHLTGIPCPGCGLTRASVLLFQGDWQRSIRYHLFAPLFVFAFVLIAGSSVLPRSPRKRVIEATESWERQTGLAGIVLICLVLYWLARLLITQASFVKLIQG